MPFLVPATVAFLCDVTVLVLRYTQPSAHFEVDHWVYHGAYIPIAAILRLVLLLLPLLFHSYTGTAVHLVNFYRFFYIGTILLIIIHMVALALMNPESLESILFLAKAYVSIWWMLGLSLASTLCHTIVLQHVRSTGPQAPVPTMYFAVRTANQLWDANNEPAYIHAMNGTEHVCHDFIRRLTHDRHRICH